MLSDEFAEVVEFFVASIIAIFVMRKNVSKVKDFDTM